MQAYVHEAHVNCVWRRECRLVPSNCPFVRGKRTGIQRPLGARRRRACSLLESACLPVSQSRMVGEARAL